jgi:hypothetical protein
MFFNLQHVSAAYGPSSGKLLISGETTALSTCLPCSQARRCFCCSISFLEYCRCILFVAITVLYVVFSCVCVFSVRPSRIVTLKDETCFFTDTTFTLCGRLCTLGERIIKMQLYFHIGLILDISRVCLTSSNFICGLPIACFPYLYIYSQSMFCVWECDKIVDLCDLRSWLFVRVLDILHKVKITLYGAHVCPSVCDIISIHKPLNSFCCNSILCLIVLLSYERCYIYSIQFVFLAEVPFIQSAPGGKVNILGGHNIGHSKQKSVYVHVCYSEQFPRSLYSSLDIRQAAAGQHVMSSHELQSTLMLTVEFSNICIRLCKLYQLCHLNN